MKMIDMFYALTDFCVCQDGGRYADEDVIAEMVGGLLEHYDKRCRHLESAIEPKRRYRIISGGRTKMCFPIVLWRTIFFAKTALLFVT